MNTPIRFGLILSALLVAACQRADVPHSSANAAGKSPLSSAHASQTMVEGSSSGGGSFGNESSMTILRWAADDLSMQIRNASPEIFAQLPSGWTQARLAQIIADVQPTSETMAAYVIPEVNRHGQRLMFDYRTDEKGRPFITSTRLFTDAYAAYEVNSRPKQEFRATLEEVKLKLAHEAAHLMGLGLSRESDMPEAREFAKRLMVSLDSDNVECLPAKPLPRAAYTAFETKDSGMGTVAGESPVEREKRQQDYYDRWTRAYVFNRPTGKGAAPSNINGGCRHKYEDGGSSLEACKPGQFADDLREYVTVFAPRSYDNSFNLNTIRETVLTGKRDYQMAPGYFSWESVDLRKAVLTDEGYRSDYLYDQQKDLNSYFISYLDYRVEKADAQELRLTTFAPLERETWSFYRSQGLATIAIRMAPGSGRVQGAKLIITKAFDRWLNMDPEAPQIHSETPLNCVRSFKPLQFPASHPATAAAKP